MSVIGQFRREGDGFIGRIATLSLDVTLRLAPSGRASAKGPDYLALLSGSETEVGAAWRASEASGAILNLKLDDPTWPEPFNARLRPAEDGVLLLTWIRQAEDKPASPPGPE